MLLVKKISSLSDFKSIAKITRPVIKGIYPRKRLFHLLDNYRESPVIWISGPPGCGKTTLVASYLENKKLPCIWYQVDAGDNNISTFFYYMGLAAKKASPRKKKPFPLLTPEYMMGVSTFTLRFFEELFRRIHPPSTYSKKRVNNEVLSKGGMKTFPIVFDNYQKISADSRLHEVIIDAISVMPEGLQIIVLSRTDPPKYFSRMHAGGKINFISWDELRFSFDEMKEIILMKERQLDDEVLLQIHEKVKGWAAGIILLTELSKQKKIDFQLIERFTPKEIFDYFSAEIFEGAEKEIQDFLLRTSYLTRITVPVAEKLTGISKSEQILAGLSREHYFTEKILNGEPFYQYHPLFREFLLSYAADLFTSKEINLMKHTAALLLEDSGQIEDAVYLFIETGDWQAVAHIIQKYAQALLSQGRIQALEGWLIKVPKEFTDHSPWLLYWLGICRMSFSPLESREYLEMAFNIFHEQQDNVGTLLSWAATVDSIIHYMG
jgi:LuxR family transcriptional regulator, maltose regulon positive regulatory protein